MSEGEWRAGWGEGASSQILSDRSPMSTPSWHAGCQVPQQCMKQRHTSPHRPSRRWPGCLRAWRWWGRPRPACQTLHHDTTPTRQPQAVSGRRQQGSRQCMHRVHVPDPRPPGSLGEGAAGESPVHASGAFARCLSQVPLPGAS